MRRFKAISLSTTLGAFVISGTALGSPIAGKAVFEDVALIYPLALSNQTLPKASDGSCSYSSSEATDAFNRIRFEIETNLIHPEDLGKYGVVFPQHRQVPWSQRMPDQLVALRIDPCGAFGPEGSGTECHPQIRVSFQALSYSLAESGSACRVFSYEDGNLGAVHVFYSIEKSELQELLRQLVALKEKYGVKTDERFGAYSGLRQFGLDHSPFAEGLKSVLLGHLGSSRIFRVADSPSISRYTWAYHAFEVDHAGHLKNVEIPGRSKQFVSENFPGLNTQLARAEGFTAQPGDTPDAVQRIGITDENDALAMSRKIQKVENPKLHTARDIDCVSCHAAKPVWKDLYGHFGGKIDTGEFRYKAPGSLPGQRSMAGDLTLLCMGYSQEDLQLCPRVLNEATESFFALAE